jgi:O-antigen/teichoic acid export membrane protein
MHSSDWSAIMLTLSRWTATFSALITAMVLTRLLDPAVYGLYSKLWLLYFIFGQVLISTISSVSMQRISASTHVHIALRIHAKISFFLALVIGLILFLGAPLLANALNAVSIVKPIRFFVPYIFFSVHLQVPCGTYLLASTHSRI